MNTSAPAERVTFIYSRDAQIQGDFIFKGDT